MSIKTLKMILFIGCLAIFSFSIQSCKSNKNNHSSKSKEEPQAAVIEAITTTTNTVETVAIIEKPIIYDYTVACYYFPNWGPYEQSEWPVLMNAPARFEGHDQPKIPSWGCEDETDPEVMAVKIDAAADHGIDVFLFDWYYYNSGPYLDKALEEGYLKAPNNNRTKFAIHWCNHDAGANKGAVTPETFDKICDLVIERYFKHPSYWIIDNQPYFSIYEIDTFISSFGSIEQAAAALDKFREKAKVAGFDGIHLNGVLFGLRQPGQSSWPQNKDVKNAAEVCDALGIDSVTSYVWIHHRVLPNFPTTEYAWFANDYLKSLDTGGAYNGLEQPVSALGKPYHPNVSMGWDSSPRCPLNQSWTKEKAYPYGAILVENTPAAFQQVLENTKIWLTQHPESKNIVTINAWNEWTEGSYLEPDLENELGYLEAVKTVFGTPQANTQ